MTQNANLKRRVRARAHRTGESYTTARSQLVTAQPDPVGRRLSIAVAQLPLRPDPTSRDQLRTSGNEIRELMHTASKAGAALVHFPEGALTSPHKLVVSSAGPGHLAEADWSGVDRGALNEEFESIRDLARSLGIWTVLGGIEFTEASSRPYNSVYVISASGEVVARYDERMLSKTKATFMYERGKRPLAVDVAGVRFGIAVGMESQYPELFAAYERDNVHCVLLSTAGNPEYPEVFAIEAAGHAATNSFWVSYAGPTGGGAPPSGVVSPSGVWVSRCPSADAPAAALAVIDTSVGVREREWRAAARAERAEDNPAAR